MKRCRFHLWARIWGQWSIVGYRCTACGLVKADLGRKKQR